MKYAFYFRLYDKLKRKGYDNVEEKTFTLKEEHIKLLSNMYVSWNEEYSQLGSPSIDLKRPYGNSDIINDIYRILEGKEIDEDDLENKGISVDDFREVLHQKYSKLHREIEDVLQIVLSTKSFTPGLYRKIGYDNRWEKFEYNNNQNVVK